MKILITGKSGQLGRALVNELRAGQDVTATDRDELDIRDKETVNKLVTTVAPDVIINAAAYTSVDLAESEIPNCWSVNAKGPDHLARAAAQKGAQLIHFSTDYVFDGRANIPYSESSKTAPLSTYGLSKLRGDEAVLNSGASAIVVRTGWLYSGHGPSFVQTILHKLMNGDNLRVINDQFGTPTSAEFLSHVVNCLIPHLPPIDHPSGQILNVSCKGSASWFDFASHCKELASKKMPSLNSLTLCPINAAEYQSAAKRPPQSCLCTSLLEKKYGITPPDWREELDRVFSGINL